MPNYDLRKKLIDKKLGDIITDKSDLTYICTTLAGYTTSDVITVCNRIKSICKGKAVGLIDSGKDLPEAKTLISRKDIEDVISKQHSSVSGKSMKDIAKFEENLKIENENGDVYTYMKTLQDECKGKLPNMVEV